MRIFLIHQYAGNKGDRAVACALCEMIRSMYKHADIVISTSDPRLWEHDTLMKQNRVQFIPNAWDFTNISRGNKFYWNLLEKVKKYTFTILRESYLRGKNRLFAKAIINPTFYHNVQKADYIISVGGHHFTTLLSRDIVSSINYDAMAVGILKKHFVCFSQSFGPFDFHNKRNKLATINILKKCKLFPRENQSLKCLKDFLGETSNIKMTYESVLTLTSIFHSYIKPSLRERVIGISVYSTQKRTKEKYSCYVNSISKLCSKVIEKGYKIIFFPMELKGSNPDDRPLICEIINKIENKNSCLLYDKDMDTLEHLQEVSKCCMFIGHKTHSTIFALTSGTPLIGIAYHPKTMEFMKQYDMSEFCIDDRYLTADTLFEKVCLMENQMDKIGVCELVCSRKIAEIVRKDFKSIFSR